MDFSLTPEQLRAAAKAAREWPEGADCSFYYAAESDEGEFCP